MMVASLKSAVVSAASFLLVAAMLCSQGEATRHIRSRQIKGIVSGLQLFEQIVINPDNNGNFGFLPNGRDLGTDPEILQVVHSLAAILDNEDELELSSDSARAAFQEMKTVTCQYLQQKLNYSQLNCFNSAFQELHTRLEISNSIFDMLEFTRINGKQIGMNVGQSVTAWLLERDMLESEVFEYLKESYYLK